MKHLFLISGVLVSWLSSPVCKAACGEESTGREAHMVERINERYDDFFRRQHEIERRDVEREKDAQDIKKVRAQHDQEMEKAREQYVKSRKQTVVDPHLEQAWNEEQKMWKKKNQEARNCYVRTRDEVETIEKKGRRIPENKEYDLDE